MEEKQQGAGRPPKYKTKEEMQEKIDEYFESCYRPVILFNKDVMKYVTVKDEEGNVIKEQYRPFTVTGLADALDMTRQSLLNYSNNEEFFDTIMRAKRKCELYAEERLYDKNGNKGAMFSLANNFENWKNKQEVDANINATNIHVTLEDDINE